MGAHGLRVLHSPSFGFGPGWPGTLPRHLWCVSAASDELDWARLVGHVLSRPRRRGGFTGLVGQLAWLLVGDWGGPASSFGASLRDSQPALLVAPSSLLASPPSPLPLPSLWPFLHPSSTLASALSRLFLSLAERFRSLPWSPGMAISLRGSLCASMLVWALLGSFDFAVSSCDHLGWLMIGGGGSGGARGKSSLTLDLR
ncbi:hypothetical protein BU15DRAFT_83401 [Melanogaster broomeanus]|nr:hypothetical protein BU15DRAFT_83401 [Melanogaster broomeanus]